MVVYFPKNGKSVCINGIQIKRPGLPMQFPVKVYEKWVEKGLLVKRPQDMDPISPEEMQRQIEQARETRQPVFVQPQFDEFSVSNESGAPVPKGIGENYGRNYYSDDSSFDNQETNEYDALLLSELSKKGVDTVNLMKDLKDQPSVKETTVQNLDTLVESESQELVEEMSSVNEKKGIFSDFSKEETELTYEKAVSMVQLNEDGSFKRGRDGKYVLTLGAKPYTKAEICEAIDKKK